MAEGPYEVGCREGYKKYKEGYEIPFVHEKVLFWHPKGPGHGYHDGLFDSYANLEELVVHPDGKRNDPPSDSVKNVIRLMNTAYWKGYVKAKQEIREALGLKE